MSGDKRRTAVRYKLYSIAFVLRNWRYHRHHKAIWTGLRDAVTDTPPTPNLHVDYSMKVNGPAVDLEQLKLLLKSQSRRILPEKPMGDETMGEFVDVVKAAAPDWVTRGAFRCKYIGEVQLEVPPDGTYHVPFPPVWIQSPDPHNGGEQ